jgi:hypothetical protein
MMEMPTFEMPIMQPMLMAVSLKQHESRQLQFQHLKLRGQM